MPPKRRQYCPHSYDAKAQDQNKDEQCYVLLLLAAFVITRRGSVKLRAKVHLRRLVIGEEKEISRKEFSRREYNPVI